ncbi:Inversin [Aphelenchoides besseyi]|nr:Inversin [Aphelenchoides besseyi]
MGKQTVNPTDDNRLLHQVLSSESGEIERKLFKLLDSGLLYNKEGDPSTLQLAILSHDRSRPLQQFIDLDSYVVNKIDRSGRCLLHWAIELEAIGCVRLLLNHGASATQADHLGIMPLHLAAAKPQAKILKLNLDHSKSRLNDCNERSPFHYAAAAGSLQCCEALLAATNLEIPWDQRDRLGQTPLMYAVATPSAVEVVRLFALRKTYLLSKRDNNGMTPLHLAVLANNQPAIRVLITEAKCNAANCWDGQNRNPLHYAALHGRVEAIKTLMELGTDVNARDQNQATPAHYAAQQSKEALKELLANSKEDVVDGDNRTSFMWAVAAQNEDVVRAFLENEMPVTVQTHAYDNNRQTALHIAAAQGNCTICKMLMGRGFTLTAKDYQTATAVHLAAGNGHSELLRQFFQQDSNVDDPDGDGKTPLFYACLGGKSHTVGVMIEEFKVNAKHKDTLNQTALHCAAFVGSATCWSKLVNAGCDMNDVDVNGRSPASLAREYHPTVSFEGLSDDENSITTNESSQVEFM